MNLLKKAKAGYLVISILYIVLGICLVAFPDKSLETICLVIGIIALAAGIYKVISSLLQKSRRFSANLDLISGIFSIAAGAILIARPSFITNLFPVIIGIVVIIDSAFKLQTAFELRADRSKHWWSVLLVAAVGLVFGFLLVFNPFEANRIALIFVGISIIIDGIENLWTVFFVKSLVRKASPIEAEYVEIDDKDEKSGDGGR